MLPYRDGYQPNASLNINKLQTNSSYQYLCIKKSLIFADISNTAMKPITLLLLFIILSSGTPSNSFRNKQMTYTRVRQAYVAKEKTVVKALNAKGVSRDDLQIYLRAFKTEQIIELWAKNSRDEAFCFIKEYPICEISGDIGPKRRVKDLQVPEGFYHLSDLNPYSKYHLSIQINYPNASDSIKGLKGRLGNLIFIHGGCESSGCLSITDELIQELYVYCIEAYNSGQKQINITIYPSKLSDATFAKLKKTYRNDRDKTSLWDDLKKHYDRFEQTKVPPTIKFLPDGSHDIFDRYKPMVPHEMQLIEINGTKQNTPPWQHLAI